MPEQWGSRPVWLIDGEPEPSVNPWLTRIAGFVLGVIVAGYVLWQVVR